MDLQAAKADQGRDEAAEEAEDEKERANVKDIVSVFGALESLIVGLRDGNGQLEAESLIVNFREVKEQFFKEERKRSRKRATISNVVHHALDVDDSEQGQASAAEDADMPAHEDCGFSSAVEEHQQWEEVRGRSKKRIPAPRAPPESGDECPRSRSPRG